MNEMSLDFKKKKKKKKNLFSTNRNIDKYMK